MPTNILSIGERTQDFLTATNADWLDGWFFAAAGSAAAAADVDNVGNGAIGAITVDPNTALGIYLVVITSLSPTRFVLADIDESAFDRGVAGSPFSSQGLTFTVSAGSTPFQVNDRFVVSVLSAPLDLTGLAFDMMLRPARGDRPAYSPVVALEASTQAKPLMPTPRMLNGGVSGVVALRVLQPQMGALAPGLYDYDLIARGDGLKQRAASGTVEHIPGVTVLAP